MARIRFGSAILKMLSTAVSESAPVITTERGRLYLLPKSSMGAIVLNISFSEYLDFLGKQNTEVGPELNWVIQAENQNFQIVVNTRVEIRDGKTLVNGREVVFL